MEVLADAQVAFGGLDGGVADGQVHFASNDVVLDAVRRFAKDATEADLDPSSDKP